MLNLVKTDQVPAVKRQRAQTVDDPITERAGLIGGGRLSNNVNR